MFFQQPKTFTILKMDTKMSRKGQRLTPVFQNANLQMRFESVLRSKESTRAALTKLQARENDPETLQFFLLKCAGDVSIDGPETGRWVPDARDVQQIKEKATWLADKVAALYGDYILGEDDTDPLLSFLERTRAPESYLRAADVFFCLPRILNTLAAAIDPWYQTSGKREPVPPVTLEFWKAFFYIYARMVAKLTIPEQAALINAVAFSPNLQPLPSASLKTQINRFKNSDRQLYQKLERSVRLYLKLPTPRKPYVQAAGLVWWGLPIHEIAALVHPKRRRSPHGNKFSSSES